MGNGQWTIEYKTRNKEQRQMTKEKYKEQRKKEKGKRTKYKIQRTKEKKDKTQSPFTSFISVSPLFSFYGICPTFFLPKIFFSSNILLRQFIWDAPSKNTG